MATPRLLGLRVFAVVMAVALLPLAALFVLWLASRPALSHDIYQHWKDPRGFDCCHGRDCAPVRADLTPEGWRIWIGGRWMNVPPNAVLGIPSPDGRSHACVSPGAIEPMCFVPGPTMF